MHWILSTTDTFSLRQTIKQSSWMLHAPFHIIHTGNQILRIERITSDKTVAVVIAQNNHNLVIHTSSNLSGIEIEELTKRTRRMLRLGEDFKPFYNFIETEPLQNQPFTLTPIFLRGAHLFEDVIRAAAFTWDEESNLDASQYTWLVDHFGDPLPSNPTLHAFPGPKQILKDQEIVLDKFDSSTGTAILHIANIFDTQVPTLCAMLQEKIPSKDLAEKLMRMLKLDDTAISQIMLSLGRYDYIPTDKTATDRWGRYWNFDRKATQYDILRFFETWQPWGGLAYWLWDWQKYTISTKITGQ